MALTADAGEDQAVNDNVVLILTGTATQGDYPLTDVLWELDAGPDCIITRGTDYICKIYQLYEGTYVFRFTVTDQNGDTASDTVDVVVTHTSGPLYIPYPEFKEQSKSQ